MAKNSSVKDSIKSDMQALEDAAFDAANQNPDAVRVANIKIGDAPEVIREKLLAAVGFVKG